MSEVRNSRLRSTQATTDQIISRARQEAEVLKKNALLEARDEWHSERAPLEKEQETQRRSLRDLAAKLLEREQQLERKIDLLTSKEREQLKNEQDLDRREAAIAAAETQAQDLVHQQSQRLEELAGISQQEARRILVDQLEGGGAPSRRSQGPRDQGHRDCHRQPRGQGNHHPRHPAFRRGADRREYAFG